MDKLIPLLLLVLGLGAAHLGIGGLLRARKSAGEEFWLFGLGVRTKLGAVKVLIVAAALSTLAYAIFRKGTFREILEPAAPLSSEQVATQARQLEEVNRRIENYQAQMANLAREKESCQEIVSKQGLGLASKNDVAAELQASLNLRQREISDLQVALDRNQVELEALKREQAQTAQFAEQSKEKIGQLESQIDVLQNEKVSLKEKLEGSRLSEAELRRLNEENDKLKTLYKEQDRRAGLLRQGLVLREANDWALEQEIQRLANLLSDQPEVNNPRQTDIARSLQKINQVLREGQEVTKQAKIADSKPANALQGQTVKTPDKKKPGP